MQRSLTVIGHTIAENVAAAKINNNAIAKPIGDPWSNEGGLTVLLGNLGISIQPSPNRRQLRMVTGVPSSSPNAVCIWKSVPKKLNTV